MRASSAATLGRRCPRTPLFTPLSTPLDLSPSSSSTTAPSPPSSLSLSSSSTVPASSETQGESEGSSGEEGWADARWEEVAAGCDAAGKLAPGEGDVEWIDTEAWPTSETCRRLWPAGFGGSFAAFDFLV